MKAKIKILIVDDDARNTFALASYLEIHNAETEIAKDGLEAITRLKEGLKPDLILLDMMMPVMDGYETLEALQENTEYKKIPVIAVTAKAMKGDEERCRSAGAWDYLAKPVDLKLLIEKISRID